MATRIPGYSSQNGYYDGQLLIAMPGIADERFVKTVIYICAHSADGAMGIVLNRPASEINLSDLLVQLDIIPATDAIRLPSQAERIQIVKGGPVESSRGFVLHTPDFFIDQSTLKVDQRICLTATLDILKAIARGEGPENAMLALGYAGWGAGQLEQEIIANGWLSCPADPSLVFGTRSDMKYVQALGTMGIDPAHLSALSGRA